MMMSGNSRKNSKRIKTLLLFVFLRGAPLMWLDDY